MNPIQGLHHITVMASDPQRNLDFYEKVLGQRLVKTTVNFDDPATYHLYYGDETGNPGTILTFFPWSRIVQGSRGSGETGAIAYNMPKGAYDFWHDRLQNADVSQNEEGLRFGQRVLSFQDPDGMRVELIETDDDAPIRLWEDGPIEEAHALRGFHGVTLWLTAIEPTAKLLTEALGYVHVESQGSRHRYKAASNDAGIYLDLMHTPDLGPGRFGAGSVHHIAFRTVDDEEQLAYLESLRLAGEQVTSVKDRQYFHSIYFRSPGGVLFEIATDAPGFLYDEPLEALGQSLKLPPWLESRRSQIEAALPALNRA